MKIELRPYDPQDLVAMPLGRAWLGSELEREAISARAAGIGWTCWAEGKPVGSAGVIEFRAGIGEAWFEASPWVETNPVRTARIAYRIFQQLNVNRRFRRIQAIVKCGNGKAVRFAGLLGFVIEGKMRALGVNGEDYWMMAIVATNLESLAPQTPLREAPNLGRASRTRPLPASGREHNHRGSQ